jgi:hypothetical protein
MRQGAGQVGAVMFTFQATMKHCWVICLVLVLSLGACKKKAATSDMVTEKSIGVAFYPKSTEWGTSSSKAENGGSAASARQTDDSPEKVIAFYKKRINEAKVSATGFSDIINTSITGKTKEGSDVEVLVIKMPKEKTQIFVSVRPKK